MRRDEVTIDLDRDPPDYQPGESLSGAWLIPLELRRGVSAVELSVLWVTEGKGDEDFGVHHFERLLAEEAGPIEPGRSVRFSVRLPRSPSSYDGLIVKIGWCVRVRAFWEGGESLSEAPFRLGRVARAVEVPA